MSTYAPLYEYLLTSIMSTISMTFSELEQLLNFPLPNSAYAYSAWWANGGHSHAHAWLDAGYRVEHVDFQTKTVSFLKTGAPENREPKTRNRTTRIAPATEPIPIDPTAETMELYGYEFRFVQLLKPKCNVGSSVYKHYPQGDYDNKKGLPLLHHGEGAFCRFSINAGNWPGVYLWVVDGQIIYIGETADLKRRFNMGYGNISPRNCYIGGQSTNCKMNKVVLSLYEQGKTVGLYFHNTTNHKCVELDLLGKINTPYNVKGNS
mgnify:CR=1 FL=1